MRCVICCYKCAASENHVSHSREGRTTKKFCFECKVALCKHCFKCFHQRKQPPLPPCSPYNYVPTGIGTRARQGLTEMTGLIVVASRRRSRPPLPQTHQDRKSVVPSYVDSGPSLEPLIHMYKRIGHYLDPSHALFKKIMNKELQHVSMQSNNLKTGTGIGYDASVRGVFYAATNVQRVQTTSPILGRVEQ